MTDQEMKYYEALDTLLNCEGFLEDCENGNYHSTVNWLQELRDYGHFKEWIKSPEQRMKEAEEEEGR